MIKIKLIEKCENCPYKRTIQKGIINKKLEYKCIITGTGGGGFWDFDSPRRKIPDPNIIPDWCGLEDAIPNLREMQTKYKVEKWIKNHKDTKEK